MHNTNSQSDLSAWLILNKTPKLGPIKIRHLLKHLQSPHNIISASTRTLSDLKTPANAIRWLKQATKENIQTELSWLRKCSLNHCITIFEDNYPNLLNELNDSPPILFVQGDINLLNMPQLAMVGSRNPSASGKQTAYQFAQYLTDGGLIINSGLAQGIDAASHLGALSCGKTIAVCATGLDRVYPHQHQKLAQQITQHGALISEFPPGTPVHKAFFPRRNRLISGLSLGTLVVEASLKSGSLITAQFALEQGREIFAIPGSIHNPMAKGCHKLIKDGAKLVENTTDIIEELQSQLQGLKVGLHSTISNEHKVTREVLRSELDKDQKVLLEVIAYSPISIDEMVIKTKLNADLISSKLLILELEGWVINAGSGRYIAA